jgi:hypothetical protein
MRNHARTTLLTIVLLGVLAVLPSSASAAVCSEFASQSAAQAAANTVDADNDGIYCESLPCPCSIASAPLPPAAPPPPTVAPRPPLALSPPSLSSGPNPAGCKRPHDVQRLVFSKQKYPNIRAHVLEAIASGWPKVMVINREGAPERRNSLRDLLPPKMGSSVTSTPPRSAAERPMAPPGASSQEPIPSAGSPTSRTCLARRAAHMAHHSAPSSGASATGHASATSSTKAPVAENACRALRSRLMKLLGACSSWCC